MGTLRQGAGVSAYEPQEPESEETLAQTPREPVAVIGSGMVGQTLGKGLADRGHAVTIASRDGKQIDGWDGAVGTFADAVSGADTVVLALKGSVAEGVVRDLSSRLAGKLVIDVTNPLADSPPDHGVLRCFTSLDESLMWRLQRAAPQ